VIDGIVAEPQGGAHRNPDAAIAALGAAVAQALDEHLGRSAQALRQQRRDRFYAIGRSGLGTV
jgi:acetyl-CoA carboxylase carboxyl transferase subunit alpha